jgi:hypothetical protein
VGTAFKDLCLDVNSAAPMAQFWATALGLIAEPHGRNYLLTDGTDEHALWLNEVPEVKSVKHRVHLDIHVAAVDELIHAGARVLDDTQPWTVLVDPEGGEFCAFVRPPDRLPRYRLYELVIDAGDPEQIAGWWADRFGTVARSEPGDGCWRLEGAGLPGELIFTSVPEPKTVKNRVHWDVWGSTAELLDAGARLLAPRTPDTPWDVLADPEANEFCVFARD